MTNLTITVNGAKSGELVYFQLSMPKANFMQVVDMEFNSIQDVLNGQESGIYGIV